MTLGQEVELLTNTLVVEHYFPELNMISGKPKVFTVEMADRGIKESEKIRLPGYLFGFESIDFDEYRYEDPRTGERITRITDKTNYRYKYRNSETGDFLWEEIIPQFKILQEMSENSGELSLADTSGILVRITEPTWAKVQTLKGYYFNIYPRWLKSRK